MPMPVKNLEGKKFGLLLVIQRAGSRNGALWMCLCECGRVTRAMGSALRNGSVASCGCANPRRLTHGLSQTATYSTWHNMIRRCMDPTHDSYSNYGGRGISIDTGWMDIIQFYADMGDRPFGHSIDRIDPNGNYTKANCRWATPSEQQRNKRL